MMQITNVGGAAGKRLRHDSESWMHFPAAPGSCHAPLAMSCGSSKNGQETAWSPKQQHVWWTEFFSPKCLWSLEEHRKAKLL